MPVASSPSRNSRSRPASSRRSRLESTASLLARARAGDLAARDDLLSRYRESLKRFAHGRLPHCARSLIGTEDLVQTALIRALPRLKHFEARREGAFLAYLRQIVLNRIRDEVRQVSRRPVQGPLSDSLPDPSLRPDEIVAWRRWVTRFESALDKLGAREREALILRKELGLSYQQITEAMGGRSAEASRKLVTRALLKLAELLPETT